MQGAQGVVVNFSSLIAIHQERPALREGSRRVSLLMCGSHLCRNTHDPRKGGQRLVPIDGAGMRDSRTRRAGSVSCLHLRRYS
ncbi:conserved hypothetical protein [Nitrospira defluvii]|uniref:Uncharacterized protein n=1 Tax=Nitrospira defluvii TaxID=330214 RepID=A0ABM8RCA0_9BACT|nr:conserved hypothetical protein [Nitrospira defluvii]